jgi:hypothetical protein
MAWAPDGDSSRVHCQMASFSCSAIRQCVMLRYNRTRFMDIVWSEHPKRGNADKALVPGLSRRYAARAPAVFRVLTLTQAM